MFTVLNAQEREILCFRRSATIEAGPVDLAQAPVASPASC
jgi:hypothetical protein